MALDHYSPCPCGSGKKLKFCKCLDQPQDYEQLLKLIEGGQGVAAVDRINQLLSKTPNAAWLLAIKGELTLSMQEIDSFKETAERFLKLKPDNPLALIMKSIVSSLDEEPVQNAARYLLEGMSESREAMPALTLSAIRILLQSLTSSGMESMVGYWSDVLSALTGGNSAPEEESSQMDPNLNLLAKSPARLLDDPANADWNERLAEVLSLAKTFRYAQAETKLRSILRDFPDQPGPLSHLLRAQCAQLDQQGAVTTARKLSQHLEISAEDRAYYTAVAFELEPRHKLLQTEMLSQYCEVDSPDRIHESMQQFDFVETADGEGLEQVRQYYAAIVGDEVPAKQIYSLFDCSLDPSESKGVAASNVGTLVVFGKQTDKPSRVLFIAYKFPKYKATIEQVSDTLQLGASMPDVEIPISGSYVEFLNRPRTVVGERLEGLSLEKKGELLVEDFLNVPIAAIDFKTPLEAANEEPLRGALLGLLSHLEGEQSILLPESTINEIYSRLDLERPSVDTDSDAETLRLVTALDLDRVPVAGLSDVQLKGLMVRAMAMGATRVFYRSAIAIRAREGLADDVQLQVAALSGLLSVVPSINERIELCERLEEVLVKANSPVGRVVIQKMSLLHAAGRPDEAQQTLLAGAQKYPNDPYLMSFIQYAMQSQGGGMPPGAVPGGSDDLAMKMMQNASRPAPQDSQSGLVLPGESSASTDEGESKLWLPGS